MGGRTDCLRTIAAGAFSAVLASLAAGCLGSHPGEPAYWTAESSEARLVVAKPGADRVRASFRDLAVRAPYDGAHFAVLRADGSVAFDPMNSFAARPAMLLKGLAKDVIASAAPADFASPRAETSFSVEVTRLALDCRREGARNAVVALTLVAAGRDDARAVRGEASVDASDGNYTRAFSQAFADALADAVGAVSAH